MSFHCRLLILYLYRHLHKISCGLGYKEMEGKEKNVGFLHSFSVLKIPPPVLPPRARVVFLELF